MRIRLGRTVMTPNSVAMNEKLVSTSSGKLALPSAMLPIDSEKTTKLAPNKIEALLSAISDKVILVEFAAIRRLWTSLGNS